MSDHKRKRTEEQYVPYKYANSGHAEGNQVASDAGQQALVINAPREQFIDAQQVQVLNGSLDQNGQMVYILLPPGVEQPQNLLQGVQTLLLVPKEEQGVDNPPHLHYYTTDKDGSFVKDEKRNEDEQTTAVQYLQSSQTDPLQIQAVEEGHNVSYTIMPQYEQQSNNICIVNNSDSSKNVQHNSTKYRTQFKCDYLTCVATFPSVYEKKLHMETHLFPVSTEFKCSICNMTFDKAIDRNRHIDSHAVVDTHKCKACEKYFPYYTSLVKHINEQKCNVKSPTCTYCGVQFADSSDLEKHQRENLIYCVCKAKLCSEQAYELHTTLCSVYKLKAGNRRGLKRGTAKKLKSDDVIVLD